MLLAWVPEKRADEAGKELRQDAPHKLERQGHGGLAHELKVLVNSLLLAGKLLEQRVAVVAELCTHGDAHAREHRHVKDVTLVGPLDREAAEVGKEGAKALLTVVDGTANVVKPHVKLEPFLFKRVRASASNIVLLQDKHLMGSKLDGELGRQVTSTHISRREKMEHGTYR